MACVKRSRRCKALASDSFLLLRQDGPKLSWSMDFVMAVLDSGRRIKRMICVDDVTKEYLTITPTFGISCFQVTHILDSIARFRGYPATIRTNQDTEFTCHMR